MSTESIEREPTCLVAGVPYFGNTYENIACRLEEGTPVMFTHRKGLGGEVYEGKGIVKFSWFYDGVNLKVDDGSAAGVNLILACRDTVLPLPDTSLLTLPNMRGDGI